MRENEHNVGTKQWQMMKQKQNEKKNQPNKPENVPDDFSKYMELTNDGSKDIVETKTRALIIFV